MKKLDFSVLKTLRLKRRMTAEQLSRKADVTRATIAKIEAGFNNPRVQTIESLAKALQLSAGDLIRLAEGVRVEQAGTESFSKAGYSGTRLYFGNLEMYLLKADKGTRTEYGHELHEDTTEVCVVLSGHLILHVGDQSIPLVSGSAVRFNAMHEHKFSVVEDTEFLLIHVRTM